MSTLIMDIPNSLGWPPMEERQIPPAWFYPTMLGLYTLATALPTSLHLVRIGVVTPLVLLLMAKAPSYSFGDTILDFTSGILMLSHIVKWADFVILRLPETSLWRTKGATSREPKGKTDAREMSVWEKTRWAVGVWGSTRGIGWNWQTTRVSKSDEEYSRIRFLLSSLHQLLVSALVVDASLATLANTSLANPAATRPSIFDYPLLERTALVWVVGVESYQGVNMLYYHPAILTVALGICRPEQWPPIFGSFRNDAYSIRRMWGTVWHQIIRKSIQLPVAWLSQVLRLSRSTPASRYFQLVAGFAVSAVFHNGGAFMLHRHSGLMYWLWTYQVGGILVEDVAMALGRALGMHDGPLARNIGRVWLFFWMSSYFAGVTASNLFLSAGHANDQHPYGFSAVGWIRTLDGSGDDFWVFLLDRWVVCWILSRALYVLAIKRFRDVLSMLPNLAVVAGLFWSTAVDDNGVDVMIKGLGTLWSVMDLFVHGL